MMMDDVCIGNGTREFATTSEMRYSRPMGRLRYSMYKQTFFII